MEDTEINKQLDNITDVFDLESELQLPTEHKTFDFSQPEDKIINEILENTEPDISEDIDTEKLKETIESTVSENFEATYDSSTLAPAIIDGVDAIIQQVFPILYERSAFSESERKLIKVLAHKQRNKKETTLNDKELELMAACAEYEEYVDSLPLKETEKKQLLKPLSELLKDVNIATTPQNALIIAALMVALPRLLPIGLNKFLKTNTNNE